MRVDPESSRPPRKKKGRKAIVVECRWRGDLTSVWAKMRKWHDWSRYHTRQQAADAVEQLSKSHARKFGSWVEFRIKEPAPPEE